MNIYVVIGGVDYEGGHIPSTRVFNSLHEAEDYAEELIKVGDSGGKFDHATITVHKEFGHEPERVGDYNGWHYTVYPNRDTDF